MIKRFAALALVPLAVSGCAGAVTGGLGLAQGALNGALAGVAPTITDDQTVLNHAETHNLKVRLQTIDDTPGLVYVQTGPGTIVVGTPMTPVAPTIPVAPTPPSPPVTTSPMPSPSGGPVVTPNARRPRHSSEIEQMAVFDWDRWGRPVRADSGR